MRYADVDAVLALLQMDDAHDEYNALIDLEEGLCDVLDQKIGRSFGVEPVAETRTVAACGSPRLVLSTPVRSVTAIVVGGAWDGSAWQGGTTLAADEYRLTNQTRQGFYAIDLTGGTWAGAVRITGVWGDQPTADVPADIREVMNDVTVQEWHRRHASPAGEIGPGELTVRPANPWTLSYVAETVKKYKVTRILV